MNIMKKIMILSFMAMNASYVFVCATPKKISPIVDRKHKKATIVSAEADANVWLYNILSFLEQPENKNKDIEPAMLTRFYDCLTRGVKIKNIVKMNDFYAETARFETKQKTNLVALRSTIKTLIDLLNKEDDKAAVAAARAAAQ